MNGSHEAEEGGDGVGEDGGGGGSDDDDGDEGSAGRGRLLRSPPSHFEPPLLR